MSATHAVGRARRRVVRRGILVGVTSYVSARVLLTDQLRYFAPFGPRTLVCDGDAAAIAASQGASFREVRMTREPSLVADVQALLTLVRVYLAVRPQASIVGTPKMGLLGGIAARLTRVPVRIYVMHGLRLEGATGGRRQFLRALEWLSCRMATRVIVVGHSLKAEAVASRVVSPDKARILGAGTHNGVDTEHYRPPTPGERCRERRDLGLDEHSEAVLFVGRLTQDKGIAELSEAWPQIVSRRQRAVLILVGEVEPSPAINDAIQALTSRADVRTLGHVDPRPYYWAADLLVLPTYREGLPTVVLEAGACGVPTVTTRVTGASESVLEGKTGHLVAARDARALAEQVIQALGSHLREQLGSNARAHVVANYQRHRLSECWRRELINLGMREAESLV